MRYRTAILLLLACILAVVPAMQVNRQQAICSDPYGEDSGDVLNLSGSMQPCAVTMPSNSLDRMLMFVAGMCALAAFVSGVKAWRDRQQDRALLQGAGFVLGRDLYR